MNAVDEIFEMFKRHGGEAYFGEPVSQTEHALETAHQAEQENAPPTLMVAALLHDVGHLLHGMGEDIADRGVDARHEAAGEDWLSHRFPPAVTEPVKLHVAAKRYLCRTDPDYFDQLSPASVRSLELQGGAFTEHEARAFEAHRYYGEALRLRRWDDAAKIPGLEVPDLEHYRSALEAVARTSRALT